MPKLWDISAPRKKHKVTPQLKREKRFNLSWIIFLAVIGAFFIVFFSISQFPTSQSNLTKPNILNSSPSTTQVSISPDISLTGLPSLKILNGTGKIEETDKIKKIILENGYKITISENALNIYSQTIIYYQPQYEKDADNLLKILSTYQPKKQQFSEQTNFNIVVVIGAK